MLSILAIAIGIAVLLFGKRLSVLGAAVGALLGVGLLRLLSASRDPLLQIAFVTALALVGFFVAGFAKGIVTLVILVLGALGGAAIALAFLDLFNIGTGILDLILAVAGGVVGLILVGRAKDWAMIVLAGVSIAYQGGLLSRRKAAATT